jgi:hypothetical protein
MADVSLKIGADAGMLRTGLSQAQNSIASFAASATKQLAGALSFTAVSAAIGSVIQKAGQLQDISDRFGVSAEAMQRIGNVAAESGGSIQDVATALARIGAAAQEAASGRSKELVQTFADIGVSGQELVRLSPEQLFYRLANAMNDGSLAGKDLATAKALLGRGFQTLLPVLRMTEQQIMAIGEATGVMTDAQVDRLDRFGDSWGRLKIRGMNALAALTDGMIRLGDEIVKNPMALATGDLDKLEKGIQDTENRDRQNAENRRQAISGMNAAADVTDTAESTKEREKQEKALEELKAGFRKTFRDREKRLDDEAHQDRMKQIDAELAKMDEAQKQKEQDRNLAVQGLDALITQKEGQITPAGAIASSLQRIGGLGEANVGVGTADSQLDELRALRNQLKEIEQRVPDTLDEIKALLQQSGGATLS